MVVLAEIWLCFDVLLKLAVVFQQPAEHRFLDLLVVFLLKELVTEEQH